MRTGKLVLVIANHGAEQQVQLVMDHLAIDLTLPPDSVHTLEWA